MSDTYQLIMKIGIKSSVVRNNRPAGTAVFPNNGEVSIVVMPPTADSGRKADIYRAIRIVIDYVRDNKRFDSAGSMAFLTTLNGGKSAIREEAIAAQVVSGDVGLMVNGAVRALGNRLDTENAHRQLLDWAVETTHT